MRRVALFATAVLVLGLVVPNVVASAADVPGSQLSPVQQAKIALGGGALPLRPEAYARAKAEVDARAGLPVAAEVPGAQPGTFRSWEGPFDPSLTPGDNTGAIGPSRYITMVNAMFAIYDRTSDIPLSTGTLKDLTGAPETDFVFDPQVMWDPGTKRFYYAMDDIVSAADNRIAWGFSKTHTPTSAADFCKYRSGLGYGSHFPDYPKLGDIRGVLLIGVNTFNADFEFDGSDLIHISKPPPGPDCPDEATFVMGVRHQLRNGDSGLATTPQPAQQTDENTTGWVLTTADVSGGETSNFLSMIRVRANRDGGIRGLVAGRLIEIPSYSMPPSAPQAGTDATLDTLDGRLLHAVSAIDPSRNGQVAVWTAHAVAGGAGSESRWYEIDVSPLNEPSLFQSGVASDPSLYTWNPGISPDRACFLATCSFGESMVMGFSTSSASEFPAAQMVSKIGAGAQSPFVMVKQSPGFNRDFSCSPCRWGDYSGASPDPTPPPGPTGAVWLTNQWNVASLDDSDVDWRTWNWAATP